MAMREGLLELLRCPQCRDERALRLDAREWDEREVREGVLRCNRCRMTWPVHDGIADLLHRPPNHVVREAAGLERFAEVMRADGWDRERIKQLPDVDIPYWHGQARAIRKVLATIPFRPGDRLLDVGSNSCWASNIFARRGLDVVALDIAAVELQGLRTADCFLQDGETFFERVLSVMFDPALASESFDYVFCCEVLHHNDTVGLGHTLHELHRVLRPGGRLLVVNEPLRFPMRLKRDHAEEVADFEGYEHVYFLHEYWRAARRAGFRVTVPGLRGAGWELDVAATELRGRRSRLKAWLNGNSVGRLVVRAHLLMRFLWKHAIRGDANLSMVGVKAARPGL
jgi:SAM-dependent methyltransferase